MWEGNGDDQVLMLPSTAAPTEAALAVLPSAQQPLCDLCPGVTSVDEISKLPSVINWMPWMSIWLCAASRAAF